MNSMNRRSFVTAAAGVAAAARFGIPHVGAHDATPAAAASLLEGYPELTVTITDAAFQSSSESVPAGLVRFIVKNSATNPTSAVVVGPAVGQSLTDLQAAMATPAPENDAPAFIYSATILGGPQDVNPGETGEVLLNIAAGDWFVFGDGDSQPAVPLKAVTGGGKTTEPAATLELLLGDFTFKGLESIKAGPNLLKVTNKGVQVHMLSLGQVPDGTTDAQVLAAFEGDMTGTPVAGAVNEEEVTFLSDGLLALSSMQTMWLPIDLEAATYFAACYFTDPATGMVHAMEGMMKVFTVA